jgi:hypothetical protein
MGQNLMGTPTTLIDRTTSTEYIYIGVAFVYNNVAPATNKDLWQITRITLDSDGNAIEIKNAHANGGPGQFFKWDDRTTLNYI